MKTYTSNEGMFGESFAIGDGYQATYVPERTVSMVNQAIGSIAAADEDDCGLLIH